MDNSLSSSVSRRLFVKSVTGLAVASGFAGTTVAGRSNNYVLGEFEDDLDGWETNGGASLSRVTNSDRPQAVENGEYALGVDPKGDTYPMIENKARVNGNSFVNKPYLFGRICTTISDLQTTLTLILRYHHGDTSAGGNGKKKAKGKSSGKKPVLVEEKELNVPFGARSTFTWDLSELSRRKLETPRRLEIGWYVGDEEPRGPHGHQRSGQTSGKVYFDSIRMTDTRDLLEKAALSNQVDNLLARHGDYEYESREFFAGGERGVFLFRDGTEIPVVWEDIGQDKEQYTVDEAVYKLGGGWE